MQQIISLAIVVLLIVSVWKVFTKAGKPGWASLIPFYNIHVLLQIIGRPWWWQLLIWFVPLVNIVIAIIMVIDLAKAFGRGVGFAVGLILLGVVFYPILAFSDAEYVGPPARG